MPVVYLILTSYKKKLASSKSTSPIFNNIHLKKAFFPFYRAQDEK